jgi:prepilin-type N-terminal cleavage/methylation domain-containing protein
MDLNRGFSLLEALVTLGILSLLTSFAVVRLSVTIQRQHLLAESARLKLFLEQARSLSIANEASIVVSITPSRITTDAQGIAAPISHLLRRGVTIKPVETGGSALRFYSTNTATPTTLTLLLDKLSCSLVISLRARIRIVC